MDCGTACLLRRAAALDDERPGPRYRGLRRRLDVAAAEDDAEPAKDPATEVEPVKKGFGAALEPCTDAPLEGRPVRDLAKMEAGSVEE